MLLQEVTRLDGSLLRTYKNAKTGAITHKLQYKIGHKLKGMTVVKCDEFGNPQELRDIAKNRYDVYQKAKDGSTILCSAGKILEFPNLVFNSICAKLFRQ